MEGVPAACNKEEINIWPMWPALSFEALKIVAADEAKVKEGKETLCEHPSLLHWLSRGPMCLYLCSARL